MRKAPDSKIIAAAVGAGIIIVLIILLALYVLPGYLSQTPGTGLLKNNEDRESSGQVAGGANISGIIIDTYGNAMAGVPVTLHVMGGNGKELRTCQATTVDEPYPGHFTISGIDTAGATCGYVTAEATAGDNKVIRGASDNFTLAEGGNVNASVVLHIVGYITTVVNTQGYYVPEDLPGRSVSWFGRVTDWRGNAQGGVPVTLHMMDQNSRELSAMTINTLPDKPFPGAFVFDMVELPQGFASAYVSASWTIKDGRAISGSSDHLYMNLSRTTTGNVVMQ
jgi:hypothetical protein